MLTNEQKHLALALFTSVQNELLAKFEQIDGTATPVKSEWKRAAGGGGTMGVIRGAVVEKAGANVSEVFGPHFPAIDSIHAGKPFWAAGVSSITHMMNPNAPTGHMNVRCIQVGDKFWVGGGGDLTPFQVFEQDTQDFHRAMKEACDTFAPDAYVRYSQEAKEYFYIKHRKSERGVGGIFFDYLEGDFGTLLEFLRSVASAYVSSFTAILERRKAQTYTEEEKDRQLYWRGRYAEFNLVYDRGTKFGLLSDGNIDAILVSMPPVVKW